MVANFTVTPFNIFFYVLLGNSMCTDVCIICLQRKYKLSTIIKLTVLNNSSIYLICNFVSNFFGTI